MGSYGRLRFGARLLRLNPGFAAIAVLSLALGIGANTAIFQLLDAVRLRTLPVRILRNWSRAHRRTEVDIGAHGGTVFLAYSSNVGADS